jgi:hypothetical protein
MHGFIKENKAQLDQVIHVFEGMLCFDRWLNQPIYWLHTSHDQFMQSVKQSIRVLWSIAYSTSA